MNWPVSCALLAIVLKRRLIDWKPVCCFSINTLYGFSLFPLNLIIFCCKIIALGLCVVNATVKSWDRLAHGWWHGTVARTSIGLGQRTFPVARSTFSCWVTMWVNRLLEISQPGQLSLLFFRGRQMSSKLQSDVRHLNRRRRHLVNAYEVKACMVFFAGWTVWSIPERLQWFVYHARRYTSALLFSHYIVFPLVQKSTTFNGETA